MSEPEKKKEPEHEQGEDKSQLDAFVSGSLRGPKRGIYQQLLALLLVKANRSNDQSIKILSICEAAKMSKNKKKLDMNLINQIYTVAKSFSASEIRQLQYSPIHKYTVDVVKMAWTFPPIEENYRKYIEPWQHTPLTFYAHKTHWRRKKYPRTDRIRSVSYWEHTEYYNEFAAKLEELQDTIEKDIGGLPDWHGFFEMASALTRSAFRTMEGEFTNWALTQLLEIQAIISQEVDPEVYRETYATEVRAEREESK